MKQLLQTTTAIMMITTLGFSTYALADDGQSVSEPHSRAEFCAMAQDLGNFQALSFQVASHMGFRNHGGLFNGGTCWWHSMFQRNSIYLSVFRPELPKPTQKEAKKIIAALAEAKNVVEIPGYANFYYFSRDYEDLLQKKLNSWQKLDGFVDQKWITGLSGSSEVVADKLKKMMDADYDEVANKKLIIYQMLQIPGIDSHAMLMTSIEKVGNGYAFTYIDSNFPNEVEAATYNAGDTYLNLPTMKTKVVGYTQNQNNSKDYAIEILRYCNPKVAAQRYIEVLNQFRDMGQGSDLSQIDHAITLAKKGKFSSYRREYSLDNNETYGQKFTQLLNTK